MTIRRGSIVESVPPWEFNILDAYPLNNKRLRVKEVRDCTGNCDECSNPRLLIFYGDKEGRTHCMRCFKPAKLHQKIVSLFERQ